MKKLKEGGAAIAAAVARVFSLCRKQKLKNSFFREIRDLLSGFVAKCIREVFKIVDSRPGRRFNTAKWSIKCFFVL